MSSFGSQIRKRARELEKAGVDVKTVMNEVQENATIAAVEAATKGTPPNGPHTKLAGTNMRSGALAQAWSTDSVTKPKNGRTILANNQLYASYVNDGHRVDKHFVPGLIVNDGLLERLPDPSAGGIMVGVRTDYVPGLFMKEKGIGAFRTSMRRQMEQRVREVIEKSDLHA